MKISIINGSPKTVKSNSEILTSYLLPLLEKEENEIKKYYSLSLKLNESTENEIRSSDILIFNFPLYVDGIPSNLLKLLAELENKKTVSSNTRVYCLVNNGFYEGKQNHLAIFQMKNWCKKVNAKWGQGIGIGAGELLPYLQKYPLGKGPLKNLGISLNRLSGNILTSKPDEDIYINPNWPKSLYFLQGSVSWILKARKNKLKIGEMFKKNY